MSATRTSMPTLSDEDQARLTELIKDSDSVELTLSRSPITARPPLLSGWIHWTPRSGKSSSSTPQI